MRRFGLSFRSMERAWLGLLGRGRCARERISNSFNLGLPEVRLVRLA